MESNSSKAREVAKLTIVGTIFVGLGAVLSVYVPALHKPTDMIQRGIQSTNAELSKIPVAGKVFDRNPLMYNNTMTRFLAVNALETFLIGGLMVGTGAIMKLCGVLPHHLEEKMRRFDKGHGKNDSSPEH